MIVRLYLLLPFVLIWSPSTRACGAGVPLWEATATTAVHPDHGASFLEQLSGQWILHEGEMERKRLRFYEDGRFGFMDGQAWTAGSYVILRSDERQKGVLRLEYYVDGNLHLQEVRCEVHFTEGHPTTDDEDHEHADHEHADHDHGDGNSEAHVHEYLLVEVLPSAEQALDMEGDYLHRH